MPALLLAVLCAAAPNAVGSDTPAEVAALLARMREEESLYENLEVRYRVDMEGYLLPGETPSGRTIHFRSDTVWAVWQSGLYFGRVTYHWDMSDGTRKEVEGEYGYDGELCRRNFMGGIGDILDVKEPESEFFPPHRWAVAEFYKAPTLAAAFEQDPTLWGTLKPGERQETTIVGREEIDGVRCIKLRCRWFHPDGSEENSRYHTWIAPERNYLAARHEQYLTHTSLEIPLAEYQVGDWREVAPGVWLPFRARMKGYSPRHMREGKRVLTSDTTYTLESAGLDPHYGIELFRDVKMPEVGPTYTIKNGEIVSTEWRGAPVPEPPRGGAARLLWLVAANLLVLAIVGLLWWIRHRARRRLAPSNREGV